MVLSDEDIQKFQLLCKSELGLELSTDAAYEQGIKLLTLMSSIYKPMTHEEHSSIQSRRTQSVEQLRKLLINEHKGNNHEEVS